MKILFSVRKQIIKRLDTERVVSSSKDYLVAKFEFTNDWNNVFKTVVFQSQSGDYYNVLLDENNECNVPYEVTKDKGSFKVSVFGEDSRLITSNYVEVEVEESGYGEGATPTPPPTEIYEQIVAILSSFMGGNTNKILAKNSPNNYDFKWVDNESGSSAIWGMIGGNLTDQKDLKDVLGYKESTLNKTTKLSAESTDLQYPTAKCVYNMIGNIENLLKGV